jgi:hypothetical protein
MGADPGRRRGGRSRPGRRIGGARHPGGLPGHRAAQRGQRHRGLHGWHFYPDWHREPEHAPLDDFQRQTRDLYIPVGDVGFWQGAFRDTGAAGYDDARKRIEAREPWTVELLYGDHEGGQRVVSRFTATPVEGPDGESRWLASASRHWNIDRPDPR